VSAGDPGRIFLVRHGETDDNTQPVRVQGRRDVPLNDAGREQARALAARAAGCPHAVASLYCTPLARSRETAEIIAAKLGLAPVVDARFAESWRGAWEGRTWEEISREDPEAYAAWRQAGGGFRFPGGESLAEQSDRVLAGLADVTSSGALPALIVCHGGTIRVALCNAHGRGLDAFHDWDVPNAAVVTL
jgi:probable phosphoglycerate mutase